MKNEKIGNVISVAIIGCLIVAIILILGTFQLGKVADDDTQDAVRNVSLLYLSELAGRREQVVSAILDEYVTDMDIALGLLTEEDLASVENLQKYQLHMKQLHTFEKFAFVDSNGLIYTSRGTRSDIDQYAIDYNNLTETQISIKNLNSRDKKVVIAVPVDNLKLEGKTLKVCFMEMNISNMLKDVSLQSNNNTTFCNIYTKDGIALTDMVLGGLASEDNLIDAMGKASYEKGYSYDKLKEDFASGTNGAVSFTYNGIQETLYYVPVRGTDWMLTYLIRESIIGEQINSISDSIIARSLVQSIITALVLIGMFVIMLIQVRTASKATLAKELSEAENKLKQQELEEQNAMQEELLMQEKKRAEQDSMITALSSDYRAVYYVDLDMDDAICYRKEAGAILPYMPNQHFAFFTTFMDYANKYIADDYRADFIKFLEPEVIREGLKDETVLSYRYLRVIDGRENYETVRLAGVRHPADRDDHTVHAIGLGFADIDKQMRESMSQKEALSNALKAAETASNAKSSFVSNMSHEIRTPITAMLGMNEMIRRETSDENILSYSDNIDKAGGSLLGIISNILDFTKIEAGHMEIVPYEYSLPGLLNDVYNLIRFRAESKGIDLKIVTDPGLPKGLIGDELRVKQIISNLLTNAVKYTEKGSVTLEISCDRREESRISLYISVSDTGIGIRAEEMEKLFSPFDRLDTSRNRSIEGTGLGLSITRQLLDMMGSELKVESTYNIGSRFYFSLWQEISDPGKAGEFKPDGFSVNRDKRNSPDKIFTAPGKNILVVDDTPMNLQVIKGLLKRTQMNIDTAENGEECLDKLGERDYDIVFLDYRMPGLDGIDTLNHIRERYPDKFKNIPIISLTASAVAGDRDILLDAGFTDYLSKPINISDMENIMCKYLKMDDDASSEPASMSEDEDLAFVPDEILAIKDLNHKQGLEYCGDAEDYLYALRTYADSSDEKIHQLEDSLSSDDLENYTLIIHSLKSMSKSVGAVSLCEKAKELEISGKAGDKDALMKDTPAFIRDYKTLCDTLKAHIPDDTDR